MRTINRSSLLFPAFLKFEGKWGEVYGKIWRKERERINVINYNVKNKKGNIAEHRKQTSKTPPKLISTRI